MSEQIFPYPKSLLSSHNAQSAALMSGKLSVPFVPFANTGLPWSEEKDGYKISWT